MTTAKPKPLSRKQELFVAEYVKDFNATQACIRAGYGQRTANRTGSELLSHAVIQDAIRRRSEKVLERVDVETTDIIRELARIAGSDLRMLFNEKGDLLPMKEWPDEIAAAVASVEVVMKNAMTGDGQVDRVLKIKLWDKPKALEMLARHKALFPKDPPAEVNVNVVVTQMSTSELEARAASLLEKRGLRLVKAG